MAGKLTGHKRKRQEQSKSRKKQNTKKNKLESFFIDSDSDVDDVDNLTRDHSRHNEDGTQQNSAKGLFFSADDDVNDDDNAEETPEQKRLRLAKEYLSKVKTTAEFTGDIPQGSDEEEDEEEHDPIAQRLRQEALRREGKLIPQVDSEYSSIQITAEEDIRFTRGHRASVTCTALTGDDRTAFTGGKDCCVIQWDVETGKKSVWKGIPKGDPETTDGHTNEVLAVTTSMDGRLVATSGRDTVIKVWDTRTASVVCDFEGHKDTVHGLAFRMGTYDLYSASHDLTVRVWNAEDFAFVETLFGHQAPVMAMDAMFDNAALSCGADGTVRYWKIPEETQLIHSVVKQSSVDCVSHLKPGLFAAGAQDGSLSVVARGKRKPAAVVQGAHGGRWITSVCGLKFTEVFASGSHDGFVKLWRANTREKDISLINKIPMNGFVNSINFSSDGKFMICGIGQEHRLGRWFREKKARNGLALVKLIKETN